MYELTGRRGRRPLQIRENLVFMSEALPFLFGYLFFFGKEKVTRISWSEKFSFSVHRLQGLLPLQYHQQTKLRSDA